MAMNVSSGSSSGDPDILVDINTTPLIDVLLVLLIMLIITIPIQLHSVNMNMPIGTPPPPTAPPDIVKIDIGASGLVSWNGEQLSDNGALDGHLLAAAAQSIQPELHVRPDTRAPYRYVAGVMASVQRRGLTKVGLVGAEQFL